MPCPVCGKESPKRRLCCSRECFSEHQRRGANLQHATTEICDDERKRRSERMKGAGCPRFNGYRTTTGNGKCFAVRAPADYPYPQSVDKRGYIREHRMVMELHLGRALDRGEVVHHVNGDNHDNRIENLRLFANHGEHMRHEWKTNPNMGRWK